MSGFVPPLGQQRPRSSDERASRLYRLLNDEVVRTAVVAEAAKRYRYRPDQVQRRL